MTKETFQELFCDQCNRCSQEDWEIELCLQDYLYEQWIRK